MTLEELAAVVGIDRADLGRIEKGLKFPSKRTVERLRAYFGHDTDILLSTVPEEQFTFNERLTPT